MIATQSNLRMYVTSKTILAATVPFLDLTPSKSVETLLKLYEIYDRHRDSVIWFLEDLDVRSYEEYNEKYAGASTSRHHFTTVCGFFELSGVLVNSKLIDQKIYFEVFNPTPFWEKSKAIIEGMRESRPHIYENFESLTIKRFGWQKRRKDKKVTKSL